MNQKLIPQEHQSAFDAIDAGLLAGTVTEQQANETYRRLGLPFVVCNAGLRYARLMQAKPETPAE